MATSIEYVAGAERPALLIEILDEDNAVIDLTGYTCSLKLGLDTATTVLTKSCTGSASGVLATWVAGDLAIASGNYIGEVIATSAGLDYRRQFNMVIKAALA